MEQQALANLHCTKCGTVMAKAGKRPDGMQRFRCTSCGKTASERKTQDNVFQTKQAVDDAKALLALQLLVEGNSIRSTERICGIHRDTIMKLLVAAGDRCKQLLAEKVRNVEATDVQCDEIWGFVGMKRAKVQDSEAIGAGDAWTFIAIERNSKIVLAYELGKRNGEYAMNFMRKLGAAVSSDRFQITTDGLPAYPYAIGMTMGDRVDYAQLIKIYSQGTPEDQRRYSPAHLAETKKTDVYGDPDFDLICTSHIERQNGSLRQWCKRLTRLTYAFSKKWDKPRSQEHQADSRDGRWPDGSCLDDARTTGLAQLLQCWRTK